MAEQASHHVVNISESTSGSPLVDVAVNQDHTTFAENGTTTLTEQNTHVSDSLQPLAAQSFLSKSSASPPTESAILEATRAVVEPSAGDAADLSAEIPAILAPSNFPPGASVPPDQAFDGSVDVPIAADAQLDDSRTPEGSVDISLNSDTEGSRADVTEQKRDEKFHVRTSSVKKPTTFSKVSVTKNFLAKTASTTPLAPKPGDKLGAVGPTAAIASIAKPRLIAKTGTSLRDIQKARLGTEGPGGPDASKVWNKNRPTPPPPQKQFTDEELKQQYGIHLATRLQTDENDKESKWADIDDDEDDWAPEAVVWMDGTKSSLTTQEAPEPPKEQKVVVPEPPKPAARPVLTILKPTELGPQKTILKPGANAAAAQQAKQNGGTPGATGEKVSLKAKSPAPAPAKSPWATLPPVAKVSPVNPPVQQVQVHSQPAPFAPQDARAYEPPPPSQPTREIAADTFDRSWREGEGGTRELFNSANGRYEPVPEGRRGSIRPDRKTAVLQRPPHNDVVLTDGHSIGHPRGGPQTDGSWTRRRGSSISQNGPVAARRMSTTQAHDHTAVEQRPIALSGNDARSPVAIHDPSAKPLFAQQTSWQQQMPARPEGEPEQEDPVKAQERIMREKRELARKRRQEEEERLEVEKQARLKARLAQLEGAGKSRKEREAEAAASTAVLPAIAEPPSSTTAAPPTSVEDTLANRSTDQISNVQHPSSDRQVIQPTLPPQLAKRADVPAATASPLESQSLPSAPKPPTTETRLPEAAQVKQQTGPKPDWPAAATDHEQQSPRLSHQSPRASARAAFHQHQAAANYRAPVSSYSSPGDRKQQAFGRSPLQNNDTFSPWPTTAPNSNVWGSSGIGNGTFEGANGFSTLPVSSSLPLPPGMARPATSTRISPQSLGQEPRSPNMQQQTTPEAPRGFAPPGLDAMRDQFSAQARAGGSSPGPGLGRQTHLPGPIAPPSRMPLQQQPGPHRTDPLAAWNSASQRLPYQYKLEAEAAEQRREDVVEPRHDLIKETFRQTSNTQGRLGAPRRYEKTEYTVHDAHGSRSVLSHSPAPPSVQTLPAAPFPAPSTVQQDTWMPSGEHKVRIPDAAFNAAPGQPFVRSAFAQHGARSANQGMAGQIHSASPSAQEDSPPPETSSHPVNSGDAMHPLVKLPPGSKPKVVVKLPPSAESSRLSSPYGTVSMPARPIANRSHPGAMPPLVASETWQARFNGLFNRTPIHTETPPSPPKTPPKSQHPALVVASASRAMMEEASGSRSATVSLPHARRYTSPEGFTIDNSSDAVSKVSIEQMFWEELSFGSKPRVAIARKPAYAQYVYAATRSPTHSAQTPHGHVETQSLVGLNLDQVFQKAHGPGFIVHIPGRIAKLSKRLAKPHSPHHRKANASAAQEQRRPSGRFSKGKAKESVTGTSHTNKAAEPALAALTAATTPVSARKASHTARSPRGPARKASAVPTAAGPSVAGPAA